MRQYGSSELVVQLLTAGLVVLLFAYLFSNKVDSNEAVGLLPLGAVLAGRMLAGRIISGGLALALALFLAANCLALASNAVQPARSSHNQVVAAWLVRHHMHSGLAGYWQASSITAFTGNRSQVRPVREYQGQLTATPSESDASWYNPRLHHASFVILTRGGGCLNACLSQADLRPPSARQRAPTTSTGRRTDLEREHTHAGTDAELVRRRLALGHPHRPITPPMPRAIAQTTTAIQMEKASSGPPPGTAVDTGRGKAP